MDINYDKALKYAYNVAYKYIHDRDKAQDIAQLTAIQLFLNTEKIDPDNLHNWLFTVTKNFCSKQFKIAQKDKEIAFEPSFFDNYDLTEIDKDGYKLDFQLYDFIKQSDKDLLHKYYVDNYGFNELAKAYKIKTKKIKDKIYRLSQEIILFQKMNNNMFSSSVSGTKLRNSLNYFLGTFIKALNENKLIEFSKKLDGCIIHDVINDIKIKSVTKITVDFCSDKCYEGIIFYRDLSDEMKVFIFKFTLVDGDKVKILEFPILPKLVISHSADNIPEELKEAQKLNSKGKTNISKEVIIDLANKKKIKIVQAKKGLFKEEREE